MILFVFAIASFKNAPGIKSDWFNDVTDCDKTTHLVVLIGRDRDEGRLGEDVRAEGRVFGAEAVVFIRLNDVDPRLVLVHRIEDDLSKER